MVNFKNVDLISVNSEAVKDVRNMEHDDLKEIGVNVDRNWVYFYNSQLDDGDLTLVKEKDNVYVNSKGQVVVAPYKENFIHYKMFIMDKTKTAKIILKFTDLTLKFNPLDKDNEFNSDFNMEFICNNEKFLDKITLPYTFYSSSHPSIYIY